MDFQEIRLPAQKTRSGIGLRPVNARFGRCIIRITGISHHLVTPPSVVTAGNHTSRNGHHPPTQPRTFRIGKYIRRNNIRLFLCQISKHRLDSSFRQINIIIQKQHILRLDLRVRQSPLCNHPLLDIDVLLTTDGLRRNRISLGNIDKDFSRLQSLSGQRIQQCLIFFTGHSQGPDNSGISRVILYIHHRFIFTDKLLVTSYK